MRTSVGLKLGFWLALFGILSTALTGYYVYRQSRDLLTRAAEQKLLTATQVLARRINYSLEQGVADLRFIAALPGVRRVADPHLGPTQRQQEERRLEDVFLSMLASHHDYFQIRVISPASNGRELVRVDRDEAGIMAVRGAELQEKAHFPYVYESLRLPDGGLYYSSININREVGAHHGLNKPTLHIATTLRSAAGDACCIVVVNVDLDGMFSRMRSDIPAGISVLLTNGEGDYLIHPDAAKTFGFDHGRRIRIQDDIPNIAPMFVQDNNNLVLALNGQEGRGESVAAFVRVPFGAPADNRFVLVGLSMPLEKALQDGRMLGVAIVQIALVFSIVALVASPLLARLLTQPLNLMARAISRFEAGKPLQRLPVERNDEIGYLARSFQSMTARLNMQVGDLQDRQLQLDYLAHHDHLTKLPNRILFLDRLIQAINKARRKSQSFAVMFIDLDKFKDINDSLGHHIGDEVLKTVALRMQGMIREEDTISRLGGDEFTIILQDLHEVKQYAVVAGKLLALFDCAFMVGNHSIELTCSIGVSIYPQHGEQAEELLDHADAAMYLAKKMGRNNFQLFDAGSAAG